MDKKSVEKKKNTSEGISVNITNPNKILYPEDKITKLDIAEYYEAIQSWILPYVINRPLTLVRCPSTYRKCFYQKHLIHKIAGLYGIMIKEKEEKDRYLYIKDQQGLAALTQLGVLEIHPWGSCINDIERPDMIIFDLDPAPDIPWKRIVKAAFEMREIFNSFKLKSFVKTTGGKGLHVVAPIQPKYKWDKIKEFTHGLVGYLAMNNPAHYVSVMTKSKRKGKIYLDYLRNQRGATSIAAYSTRARKNAPVSTPLAWDELTNNIRDTFFTIDTLPKRLAQIKKDPWADFFKIKQSLNLEKLK